MTRVDENRDAERAAEQRRAGDEQKASQRRASAEFQKVVAQKLASARETQKQQGEATTRAQQHAQTEGKASASAALLARQGIQSRNLAQALHQRGEQSVEKTSVDAKGRREDLDEKESRRRDGRAAPDEHAGEHDPLASARFEKDRDHGAGNSASEGGTDRGGQREPGLQPAAPGESHAAGASAPRMPPEVLQKLVERVFAGVTPEGVSQFTLELKGDVLGGARLDVTGKDGKIICTLHSGDASVRRLVSASEGALARALGHKGLTLVRLEVVERRC